MTEHKVNIHQRTEEIQDIIERMPINFGLILTYLSLGIVAFMIFFGSIIRYPDIVSGNLSVNTKLSPIKLVSETNGRLKINHVTSQQKVYENQVLAWIENSTTPNEIKWLDSMVKTFDIEKDNISKMYSKFPRNKPFGELTSAYSDFLLALKNLDDYRTNRIMKTQIKTMNDILKSEGKSLKTVENQQYQNLEALSITNKFFTRDSTLFSKKVISASELDRSLINRINASSQHQEIGKQILSIKETIGATMQKISELEAQNTEYEHAALLKLMTSKNVIIDRIKDWEHKYQIKSLFDGTIQFSKFWNQNDFVNSGDQIFTLIPNYNKIEAQVILPAKGAGKVKKGQEVIIKLDNYPYLEYGSVKGIVGNISMTTSSQNTPGGTLETYLIVVDLPAKLKTNYGSTLEFKNGIQGTAEIVTKDRSFISRVFESLKYSVAK